MLQTTRLPGNLKSTYRGKIVAIAATCIAWNMPGSAAAHTLPISRMTIVADEEELHVEVVVNAEELAFFTELDDDRDGRLAPPELAAHGDAAAKRIFDKVSLHCDGRALPPTTCGFVPGGDGHHLAVRAHYAINVTKAPLVVEATIFELTRGAHSTEVAFVAPHLNESAILDARSRRATFHKRTDGSEATPDVPASRVGCLWIGGTALFVAAGVGLRAFIRTCQRKENK